MTTQPVEANVVLTADNTQYDQAMTSSAGSTNSLGTAVDSLGKKISGLTKAAGKGLIGISAADVALIGGATAAWASYEKQVSRLQAQAAILTRTEVQQQRVMTDYTTAVKGLRTEYGTTAAEASKLVGVLSKMTTIRQSRDLSDLSKVFTEMGKATGESSEGLASSMTNLQKIMGAPINSRTTEKYADMFTHLSAQTQTSAQGLIEFTAQLAPVGDLMGMNTKQVAGFATAFEKAGAAGAPAATVFTKVATDITRSLASGSPEIAHYANLIGKTSEEFKKMDAGEQMVQILEAIQKMGPRATVELERLGLEGPRTMKAISAVINQPGGVREAVAEAGIGARSDATGKGAAGADTLSAHFDKLRQTVEQTAESFGSRFAPILEHFVDGMNEVAKVSQAMVEGPFGDLMGLILGLVAPLAGGAGAMLLFAGALLKVAAAFMVFRSSAAYGVREGLKGGSTMTRLPDGSYVASGSGTLGARGAQLAEGKSTWGQRLQYNVGATLGGAAGGGRGIIAEQYMRGREWFSPTYQRPEGPRSMLSYAAGGFGRGMQNFVIPQFDQMRYADPTKRMQWLGQETPWAGMRQRIQLGRQMGAVGGLESQLSSIRKEELGVRRDTGMDTQARAAVLEGLRSSREETKEKLNSARASERVTRESINGIQAQKDLGREAGNNARGFQRATQAVLGWRQGLVGGVGGGIMGAGRAGFDALRRNPQIAGSAIGMGVMAGASALDINNTAIMGGSMGAMLGGGVPGAIAGATIGATIDVVNANKATAEGLDAMNSAIDEGGSQFTMMSTELEGQRKTLTERLEETGGPTSAPTSYSGYVGRVSNQISDLFGESDSQENQRKWDEGQKKYKDRVATAKDLAKQYGLELQGTEEQQAKQLEDFMADHGEAMLTAASINFEELAALRQQGVTGGAAYIAAMAKVEKPGEASGLNARLRSGGGTGRIMMQSETAQEAIKQQGDVALFYQATHEIFAEGRKQGMSWLEIIKESEAAQENIADENSREYELQAAVSQQAQQGLAVQMQMGGRVEAFQSTLGMQMALQGRPSTEENVQQLEAAKANTKAAFVEQANITKQQLLQQHQFEVQQQRAAEDYHEQVTYQLEDYEKQRNRAEFQFNRSRNRATADYFRNVRRAQYDYHLQRERQEEDFNHQIQINVKQQAQGIMDIYQRVEVQRTASAAWTLSNAQDQLQRMREQAENLDKLRQRGMSDTAIQNLGLGKPENAQQLARFMTELTPAMIRQFNRVAGTERVKAVKDIVTDPSSLEWQEMRRGFRLSRERAQEDFSRGMRISRTDFRRGLRQQRADFNIMMDQQADDFDEQMQRQEKAYRKSMNRAAEDLADSAREINGSLMQVLRRGSQELTGFAQQQAQQLLNSLRRMRKDASPEAVALMQELSDIFGFKYKAPGGSTAAHAGDYRGSAQESHVEATLARHEGGTVPGWTPGRDVVKVNLSGGEAIMRPEWARAVGEKGVQAMNHAAKHGGFREGGVFWPVPGHDTSTYQGHDGVDINRGSGSDDMGDPIRAFRSGRIVYVGSGRGYGDAIFQQTRAGTVVYGHTSAQFVHAGQRVAGGELIGNVGSTGNSSAPHLHFGIPGGTYAQAMALLAGAMVGKFTGMRRGTTDADIESVFKDRYPHAERAVRESTSAIHPLKPGDISAIINRYGHRALRGMLAKYGDPGQTTGTASDIGREPSGHHRNEQIVHIGARRMGWGNQWPSLRNLVMNESGFNNLAQNPTSTAYGLFQFLDSTWAGTGIRKTSDPWKQTQAGLKYIKNRYGNPAAAWNFWQGNSPHWYGRGGVFSGAQTIGIGEGGPEAVLPLDARGGEFMAEVMSNVMGGRHQASMRGGTNIFARVDRSTNFTGPITVQANDPAELIHKLQARQRVMALSRPVLTGSAA